MNQIRQTLGIHPGDVQLGTDTDSLAEVIDAATDCAQPCGTDTDTDMGRTATADDRIAGPLVEA